MTPTIAEIQAAVAREFKVPVAWMREPALYGTGTLGLKRFDVSHPRQAAMHLAVLLTEHSFRRVGDFFGGRERTTVRHAHFATAQRRRTDAKLHAKLRRVSRELVGF